ncbi:MAG: hypothetical protein WCJ37_00470 [Syntrophus sp. (in: bacteria)]
MTMKRHQWIVALAVITMVFSFATAGEAGKKAPNQSKEKAAKISDDAKAVADLNLAAQLVKYGRAAGNPSALLVAAQIIKNTPTQDTKRDKKAEGKAAADKGTKSGAVDTPEQLLAEAKKMAEAKNMDQLGVMIDNESKILASKGAVLGPGRSLERVMAGQTDIFRVAYKGGELARLAIVGDGDCDLDLFVYDQNGNFIVKSDSSGDREYVEWTPRWEGYFYLKVKNQGGVYANYWILTN